MIRSVSLQRLIYRSALASSLVPIFAIEIVLLLLYFSVSQYLYERQQDALLTEVNRDLIEISQREAALINNRLQSLSRLTMIIRDSQESFFRRSDSCVLPNGEPVLQQAPSGAWYKAEDNGGGSVYYSAATALDSTARWKMRCSESLDVLLKASVDASPLVTQAYLNTRDDMNRIYPFIPNSADQFGPAMHMADYNFYYLADAQHNPGRGPVWTDVYLDPAGQGWMVSSIAPVYNEDVLEGVAGIDITVERFIDAILGMNMPWNATAFMTDANGKVMAMPAETERLLGVKATAVSAAEGNIGTAAHRDINLLQLTDPSLRTLLSDLLVSEERLQHLMIHDRDFIVSVETVAETGWRIVFLVDEQQLLKPIADLQTSSNRIGFLAISVMVIFYAAFFAYLDHKSRRLASRLANPIIHLSEVTGRVGETFEAEKLESVGISEIDRLYANFNHMNEQLRERTQALVDSESRAQVQRKEAEILERLAITDRLTGLYNRRKLDEVMAYECERSLRSRQPFGVVILDIDHFKSINDQFGHPVGDQVITELALLLRSSIRRIDIVGRWGGEEFILICPTTDINGTLQVAETLRGAIAKHSFPVIQSLTASFGVAAYVNGETLDELVNRADKGLYDAKRSGRNRVGASMPAPRGEDGVYL